MKIRIITFIAIILSLASCGSDQKSVESNTIKWNFEKYKKFTYSFEQEIDSKMFGQDSKIAMTGKLIVSVNEKGLADIVLKDMESDMVSKLIGDEKMTRKFPDVFIQGMDNKSQFKETIPDNAKMLALTLFPLPTKQLQKGDTNQVPMSMPFNVYGSVINVIGANTLQQEELDAGKIKINSVFDISEMSIPKDADVNYTCFNKGKANYTFNKKEGYFEAGTIFSEMVMKNLSGKSPLEDMMSEDVPDEFSNLFKGMASGLEMKSSIKYKLLSVE